MELSTRKGLMIFRKRTLSRAIQLLLVTWAAQSMGAQVDAEEGQVLNFTNLEWDHSSPLVLNSEGAGASINVNGVGQFDLSDGAVLLNAANGGAIHLNGGGEINIVGGRIGKLDNANYGAIGGGTLSLINYKISIDNSSQLDNSPILALNTSENNQLSQLRVNYIGKGEFLKVSGAQATLTDNNIEVNDSNGAMVLTSQTVSSQTTASNVTINGGYYYGSNNIDYLRDTTSTGATIDVGGGSSLTLENGAYIGSSDNSQALQLRYANTVTVNDSSVSGGNAGILSSSRGGRVIINNGRIEGRFGSAILINPYTYSSSNTVTSVKVNAKDSVLLGQYGLRVEQRGSIEAQLSNTQLQATDAAISVNRLNYNQNKTLKISAELTNGSHIIANDAFQAHAGTLDITLRDSLVDAASSAAVTSEGGRVDLYTERSSIKGDLIGGIRTGTSDGINVTLTDGSSLTGYAENVKTLVLEDSDWHLTANSSVSTLQNLSGNIIFGSPVDINAAGDYKVLTVDGNYTGGGILTMNTWFAGDSSNTDKLDIVGDSSGQTTIAINNVGGGGELTSNGIKIVDVRGASQGVFNLYQRVIAGMYEYDLYKNDVDGGWYLQSSLFNPSTPDEKDIAPEYGTHLTNLSVAANMFMHSLHDRMGEPQFSDDLKNGNSLPGVWVKIAAGKAQYKTANGQMKSKIETTTLRMGADIAQWSLNGDDRFHVGLMGAFADSDVNTSSLYRAATNGGVSRDAIGSVKGYSAGTYATWYENSNSPSGLYLDSWFQYGWFTNKVQGAGQREERYDSKGWTASIETGYALLLQDKIDYQFMLEPQVQIAYNNYGADDYLDSNLTQINDSRAKGLVTRLGTRIYTRSAQATNVIQPFIEANWWYNDSAAKQTFSGVTMKDGLPKSRYEIKTGIQSHFGKGWQAWGYIGSQWGDNSYSSYQGSVGLKRVF